MSKTKLILAVVILIWAVLFWAVLGTPISFAYLAMHLCTTGIFCFMIARADRKSELRSKLKKQED